MHIMLIYSSPGKYCNDKANFFVSAVHRKHLGLRKKDAHGMKVQNCTFCI